MNGTVVTRTPTAPGVVSAPMFEQKLSVINSESKGLAAVTTRPVRQIGFRCGSQAPRGGTAGKIPAARGAPRPSGSARLPRSKDVYLALDEVSTSAARRLRNYMRVGRGSVLSRGRPFGLQGGGQLEVL